MIEGGYVGFLDADDEIIYPEYVDSYVKGVRSGADRKALKVSNKARKDAKKALGAAWKSFREA